MVFHKADVEKIREQLPELPLAKQIRFQNDFGLSEYDAGLLVSDVDWSQWFEECIRLGGDAKQVCNWMNGDFARLLNEYGQAIAHRLGHGDERELSKVTPGLLVELIQLIADGTISGKIAKTVFEEMFGTGKHAKAIVEENGLPVIADAGAIEAVVAEVLSSNPAQVEQYRAGKETLIGFFVGQVMRNTQGRAEPQRVQAEIVKQLSSGE